MDVTDLTLIYQQHIYFRFLNQIGSIPIILLAVYRLLAGPDYSKCKFKEKYRSVLDAVKLQNWGPTIIHNPDKKDDDNTEKSIEVLEENWVDLIFKTFLRLHVPHYTIDASVKILKCLLFGLDSCKVVFLSHHITSLVMCKTCFMMDHYPWYCILVIGWHSLMCAFPNNVPFANVAYGAILINMEAQLLFRKTFR